MAKPKSTTTAHMHISASSEAIYPPTITSDTLTHVNFKKYLIIDMLIIVR
jgi:hypothetical protein